MNNLIKESLIKLKQNNINNPELDIRILLKHASKKNNEIIGFGRKHYKKNLFKIVKLNENFDINIYYIFTLRSFAGCLDDE